MRSYLCGVDEAKRAVVELRFLGVAGLGSGRWSPGCAVCLSPNLIGSVQKSRKGDLPAVTSGVQWTVTEITVGSESAFKFDPGQITPPERGKCSAGELCYGSEGARIAEEAFAGSPATPLA